MKMQQVMMISLVLALAVSTSADGQTNQERMETRFYVVPASTFPEDSEESRDDKKLEEAWLKDFFGKFGVSFAEGSRLSYYANTHRLVISSVPETLTKVEHVLKEIVTSPLQVRVAVELVELKLAPNLLPQNYNRETLTEWPADSWQRLRSAVAITKSGKTSLVRVEQPQRAAEAKSPGKQLQVFEVTPVVADDGYKVELDLRYEATLGEPPNGIHVAMETTCQLWDHSTIAFPLSTSRGAENSQNLMLILSVDLLNPAGESIRAQ